MRELQETWLEGRVIRLNLSHEPNVAYAKTVDVVDLPTFILFDRTGKPLRRWVGVAPTLTELVGLEELLTVGALER